MVTGFEEIKDYLESNDRIDANITAQSYYAGNHEAVTFIAFLDELGIRWVSGKTAKEHCDLFNNLEDRRIVIVKNERGSFNDCFVDAFNAMFQIETKQQQPTHYFNPETKELLKLI